MDISTTIETISPNLAAAYLESNTANRKVDKKTVARLASDMLAGFWQLTGDSIKFAENGELVDGQHRLLAVIKANTPQKFLVVRGVSLDCKMVTDTGRPRTFANVLDFSGGHNTVAVASIARMSYFFHYGRAFEGCSMSHTKLSRFVDEFPQIWEIASWAKRNAKELSMYSPESVWGLARFATSGVNESMSDEFFSLFFLPPRVEDHPVVVLKKSLTANYRGSGSRKGRASRSYLAAIILKAWVAFYEKRSIKMLKFIVGEQFPFIPDYPYGEDIDRSDS